MWADVRNPRVVIPSNSRGDSFQYPLEGYKCLTKFVPKNKKTNF